MSVLARACARAALRGRPPGQRQDAGGAREDQQPVILVAGDTSPRPGCRCRSQEAPRTGRPSSGSNPPRRSALQSARRARPAGRHDLLSDMIFLSALVPAGLAAAVRGQPPARETGRWQGNHRSPPLVGFLFATVARLAADLRLGRGSRAGSSLRRTGQTSAAAVSLPDGVDDRRLIDSERS